MEINNIADIAAFIASTKSGSFTAAAKQMGLTRSTIGKRIARLEQQLGVRLLQRTTRQLALTEEGRLFFEHCQTALDELEAAGDVLAQRHCEPIGRLRLTMASYLGKAYANPILIAYRCRYPKVQIELSFTDRFVDLVEEGFDLALRIGGEALSSGLSARTVAKHDTICCASPDYLAKYGTPQTPDDLLHHQCIHFLGHRGIYMWQFRVNGKIEYFSSPNPVWLTDNGESMLIFAKAGEGIAWLPKYLVGEAIRNGDLLPILQDYQVEGEPIQLVYPSKRHLSPKVRSLIDLWVEMWAKLPWE